ncbi:MAG: hypothetical protein Q7W16_03405 [Coriobacteriia bacterium]|nr:hypothetical protein [Coriobacteriia bacterium]
MTPRVEETQRTDTDERPLPWFRVYADMMTTPALRKLHDYQLRVFLACMSLAAQSPADDRLAGFVTMSPSGEPLDTSFIKAEVWTGSDDDLQAALDELIKRKLLTQREDGAYRVAFRWCQYASDNSTERSRKSRGRSKPEKVHTAPLSLCPSQDSTGEQSKAKGNAAGNVAPCRWCGGSGQTDGHACPSCDGTGMEAA